MFEPFNPELVPQYRRFHYFQYKRPGEVDPDFYSYARGVFTGAIRGRWIDRQNERIFAKYRLIKEIRANLSLKWLYDSFPDVPMLLIVRHPCAVVLSRMQLKWATDRDIQSFRNQPALIDDHLSEHMDFINGIKTVEEKHAIIWSVSNLVPIRQFNRGELSPVFYENLCMQPEKEIEKVFQAISQPYQPEIFDQVDRPSMTTKGENILMPGKLKAGGWKSKLSSLQIDNILRVVEKFGLDNLYDAGVMPRKASELISSASNWSTSKI